MPTGSTTITDQSTGNEVATQTYTEDSVTKHVQRVIVDQRLSSPPRRFSVVAAPSGGVTAVTTVNTNICGIQANTSTIYIKSITMTQYNTTAGTIVPIAVKRCGAVTSGTQITAANIPEHWTAGAVSDAIVRYGTTTAGASEATERLMILTAQGTIGAINAGGVSYTWQANSLDDSIVLLAGEGLIFEVDIASDTDNRYLVGLSWEEVA
jgi:hypothetical protein